MSSKSLDLLLRDIAAFAGLDTEDQGKVKAFFELLGKTASSVNSIMSSPTTISGATIEAGGGNVILDDNGIKVYNSATQTGAWETDGDFRTGSDISAPATTSFNVFATARTYNGEAMEAGAVLQGDNSANKANTMWQPSTGRMLFRGGTTTQAYVDTDGSIKFGAGVGTLNSSGAVVALSGALANSRSYRFTPISGLEPTLGVYGLSNASGMTLALANMDSLTDSLDHSIIIQAMSNGSGADSAIINIDANDGTHHTNFIVYPSGITLSLDDAAEVKVTEFSTDTTCAGDSDTALVTEHVLKTYADTKASTATKLDDFAAPDDNTDLNATTSAHGLCPKGDGDDTHFLNGDLGWSAPAGGGGDTYNYIINGGFGYAQRQVAATLTTIADVKYGPDRWMMMRESASVRYSRNDATGETGLASKYYGLITQITNAGKFMFLQCVEGESNLPLRGQSVTFEIKMKASGNKTMRMAILSNTGTIDDLPADPVAAWGANTTDPTLAAGLAIVTSAESKSVTTSWTKFSVTKTIPATCKNVVVAIWTDSQWSDSDILSMAEAGLYITAPAAWQERLAESERALVHRFYQRYNFPGAFSSVGVGQAFNSTPKYWVGVQNLATPLRTSSPTFACSAAGDFSIGGGTYVATTFSLLACSGLNNLAKLYMEFAAVANGFYLWEALNAGAWFDLDAEIY